MKVSKINEVELEQQLNEKLKEGKLDDANNDGIINQTDIEVVKENIKNVKRRKGQEESHYLISKMISIIY